MTDPLEMPENIMTMEPLDCFTSSTSPITTRIVLSKRLDYSLLTQTSVQPWSKYYKIILTC